MVILNYKLQIMYKLLIFISGDGSNLQSIIDECNNGILNAKIVGVISNKENAYGMKRAENNKIPTYYKPYISDSEKRDDYDEKLANFVLSIDHDLIILAGWMLLVGKNFLNKLNKPIINLHPALPGQFPGKDAIKDAFNAYKLGKIKNTGVMVHHVVEEMDAGNVIDTTEVPILNTDTEDILRKRIKYYEKSVLLHSIQKVLLSNDINYLDNIKHIYSGKVREVYDIGYGLLAIESTDRQSAFDRHICNIPNKGKILNKMSGNWFITTHKLIPNHYIHHDNNIMIVKKCLPFLVEVVVRGYMTGSTDTSLWTHYSKGVRNYCGHTFPDGMVKNQKLDKNYVTPTTKGKKDELISSDDIVKNGLMTSDEWKFVEKKALELFDIGQKLSEMRGLILVDTKYEFGKDLYGNIILIDELHTCDSSRYWLKNTYNDNFIKGKEPDKFDKDIVRDWIKKNCNPYTDILPEIPNELIQNTSNIYSKFLEVLSNEKTDINVNKSIKTIVDDYFSNLYNQIAVIISGSDSDSDWVNKINNEFKKLNIFSANFVASAHKNTSKVLEILNNYNNQNRNIVFITVAGRSNALGGVVAANSKFPVINCPPYKDKMDMMVNINSSIQNPSNVPVALIMEPVNVALFTRKIFKMG